MLVFYFYDFNLFNEKSNHKLLNSFSYGISAPLNLNVKLDHEREYQFPGYIFGTVTIFK